MSTIATPITAAAATCSGPDSGRIYNPIPTAWTTVSPRETQRADQQRAAAMRLLHEAGWAVAEAGPEETATQVWSRLGDLGRSVAPVDSLDSTGSFSVPGVAS